MSALLAAASATFTYQGANVTLSCSSATELLAALREFGVGHAANDAKVAVAPAAQKPATTAAPQVQPTGNASASTGTPASAPAAGGGSAETGDDQPRPTYQDVSARITTLCKKPGGRDKCIALLKTFTGQNGQPADHGNKLKLEDYPAFIQKIDAEIGGAA